jgi:hypothetical protein
MLERLDLLHPLWRKKIRTAQRVDVAALMDLVTPAPPPLLGY